MKKILSFSFVFFLSVSLLCGFIFVSASVPNKTRSFESIENTEVVEKTFPTISDEEVPKAMPSFSDKASVKTYEEIHEFIAPDYLSHTVTMTSFMDYPTTIPVNSHSFFLYAPKFVTKKTPLIIACHGYCSDSEEMAGFGEGNFALYTQVYRNYHPNAIILFPTKDYNGEWIASEIVKLTKDFVRYYQLQGNIYYYGFSQGCLNGPDIIQQYGNFTAAVFVDEDFIAYPYPQKDCPPRGLQFTFIQLSSLKALRIAGCNHVDSPENRHAFADMLKKASILYEEEIYPPNTYEHLEVSDITVRSCIDWLLSI